MGAVPLTSRSAGWMKQMLGPMGSESVDADGEVRRLVGSKCGHKVVQKSSRQCQCQWPNCRGTGETGSVRTHDGSWMSSRDLNRREPEMYCREAEI